MVAKIDWTGRDREVARARTVLRMAWFRRDDLPEALRDDAEAVLLDPTINTRLADLVNQVGAARDDRFNTSRALAREELSGLLDDGRSRTMDQVYLPPLWAF